MIPFFSVLVCLLHPRPQLAYPISRKKQAEVVFYLGVVQLASIFMIQLLTFVVIAIVGQAASGALLPARGLLSALALALPILVAGPFMLAAVYLKNGILRILGATVAGVGLIAISAARGVWLPKVTGVTGIAILAGVTIAGVSFYWWNVNRHYRRADILPGGISGEIPILQGS